MPFRRITEIGGSTLNSAQTAHRAEIERRLWSGNGFSRPPPCLPWARMSRTEKAFAALDARLHLCYSGMRVTKVNDNLQQMAHIAYMHLFFGKPANGTIGDILVEKAKSPIQVGKAQYATGEYPFFTSGDTILNWSSPLVDGRNLFLNTGGNAGVKFYIGKAAYSTDTWCITTNGGLADYLFLLLDSIKVELSQKFFQGTGLKHLQKPMLKARPIYIPTEAERKAFNESIMPWMTMVSDNTRESQRLIALRDWLLPLLMNGQATISD